MQWIARTMSGALLTWGLRVTLILVIAACSHLPTARTKPASQTLKLVVGPVSLEAAITKSAQIYSFNEEPSSEYEPRVLT